MELSPNDAFHKLEVYIYQGWYQKLTEYLKIIASKAPLLSLLYLRRVC